MKKGRPRNPAAPAVLVPAELVKQALREVAKTPVEETSVQRFIEVAASDLEAAFEHERPKAEILRKVLPILHTLGWQGQEADIEAVLDAYEAQRSAKTSAAVPRSASPKHAAPTPTKSGQDRGADLGTVRASPNGRTDNPLNAPAGGSARQVEADGPATGGELSREAAPRAPVLPTARVDPNYANPMLADGAQARARADGIAPAGVDTMLTTPRANPSRGPIGQTEPASPTEGTAIITPSKSDAAHDQRPGSLKPRSYETPSDRHSVDSPPDPAPAPTRITRPEPPRGDGQAGDALRPPSPYEHRLLRPRTGFFADDGDRDTEDTEPKL